ncbi:MAG: hypothetical protein HKL84_01910 [Acidimicrobiaceae bacterium]|nr:hypothetical protein [Acidimicrobiaceae bacterium]
MAFFSVYIAFNGFGVSDVSQVSDVVGSVSILPTPLGPSTVLGPSEVTAGGNIAGSAGKKLIEVPSSSPVLNYSDDASRLTQLRPVSDAGYSTVRSSTSSPSTTEYQNTKSQPVPTSDGGDHSTETRTTLVQQPASTGQASGVSTTTTSTTSTTSTTIASSDGKSTTTGTDN